MKLLLNRKQANPKRNFNRSKMDVIENHKRRILSLNIDLISYADSLEKIITMGLGKDKGYVCFANVHMVIEAKQSESFAQMVNSSSLVLSDGMPLVKALKLLYNQSQERIAGMDVFPDLLMRSDKKGLRVFFFGTTHEILNKIDRKVSLEYPTLKIAGMFSPPFDRPLNDQRYVSMINDSQADLVFVALGCPKQEIWMSENSSKIDAVLLGVGGAFPVFAEVQTRAPKALRNMSLEWLYRLYQEPGRLFKRYFKTNSMFLYFIFLEKLRFVFKN
jgi:N-acetylglucosaminyldiphosphoundecaprenol N-acetyl-beta-D-mannosaminyltransferase